MTVEASRFTFENRSADPLVVEHLQPSDIDETMAREALALRGLAYAAQLEGRFVPRNTMKPLYEPADALVATYAASVRAKMERGTAYWAVTQKMRPEQPCLSALAGVTPEFNDRGDLFNITIDQIFTDPFLWRRSLGSRTLFAALSNTLWSPRIPVHLAAFVGSSVNEWYKKIGLRPTPSYGPIRLPNGAQVEGQRMATPHGQGLGTVRERLLRSGRIGRYVIS